jgi:AraC-like DNA-binding protein
MTTKRTFDFQEALLLRELGHSLRDIARRLGVSRQTISRALRDEGYSHLVGAHRNEEESALTRPKRRYQFPDGMNYPILEARKVGTMILVKDCDVDSAERRNPTACAIAKAAERMGYERAYIAGTVAYLVTTVQGEKVAIKYNVPRQTRAQIKHFDETGEMPEEGFVLRPLHNGQTHQAWKERSRKPEAKSKQRARQRRYAKEGKIGERDLRTFRHLSGQVRTISE